jgi:hypothetical protein
MLSTSLKILNINNFTFGLTSVQCVLPQNSQYFPHIVKKFYLLLRLYLKNCTLFAYKYLTVKVVVHDLHSGNIMCSWQ